MCIQQSAFKTDRLLLKIISAEKQRSKCVSYYLYFSCLKDSNDSPAKGALCKSQESYMSPVVYYYKSDSKLWSPRL